MFSATVRCGASKRFLVHHRNADRRSIRRTAQEHFLALPKHPAAVALHQTRDNFHQRDLPAPFSPIRRCTSPRLHAKIAIPEGGHAAKTFLQ